MSISRAIKLLSLIKGIVKSDYEKVSDLMGEMHGVSQKLGQHFTLYRAPGFNDYFQSLCTDSKAENIPVEKILKELGLSYIDFALKAQASIGQVYQVRTGRGDLAVKVKYPGVEKRIRGDLKTLKRLLWPTRFLPLKNSALLPMLDNLTEMLLDECDYMQEAETQTGFHDLFNEDNSISIPKVKAYNNGAIASEWVTGSDLRSFEDSEGTFVCLYLRFLMKSLKELGMVHADPHPGNFILSGEEGKGYLTVIDFGSVVKFSPSEKEGVLRLLSGDYKSEAALVKDLAMLGMDQESIEVYRPIIGDLVSILLEPFYFPGEYDFANWRMQYKVNTLMASQAWEKPMKLPVKLILFFRALQGLYFYARKSRRLVNWNEAIKRTFAE